VVIATPPAERLVPALLLVAVAVGVVANLLIVLRELNHAGVDELRPTAEGRLVPAVAELDPVPGMLILRIAAPLYTANVRGVQAKILDAVAAADPQPAVVVVDATVVGTLSVTGLAVFRALDEQLGQQGVELWFASLPPRALAQAHLAPGWERFDRAGRPHPTAAAAVAAFRDRASRL
jgi:MFS superfamily sulfate permease-like transporter